MTEPETTIPISKEVLDRCACTHPTLVNWIKRYKVDNQPIGVKIGGQWRVYPKRLERFLAGEGMPNLH